MKPLIPAPWKFNQPVGLRLIDVRSATDLASHAPAWRELLLQSPAASPMVSYPQISAFFEMLVPPSETWCCLFAYEGDQLIGVFPLIAASSVGALGFSILFLKTPYDVLHTSGVDCLTLPGREDVIEVFVDYLSRIPRTWPLIRMRELPEGSTSMIYQNRPDRKLRSITKPAGAENHIEVPASYEAYHAGFSSNFRRQLKRGARKLDEQANVRFSCRDDSRSDRDNVKRFEEIETSGWKGEEQFTLKAVEGSTGFFTLAAERFREQGWMEWNFIEIGDRTIAVHYAIRIKRTVFLLKICYDDEFSACSPGNLLLEKAVQHAIKAGDVDVINCVADCAWHKNWNMTRHELHDLFILPKIPVIPGLIESVFKSNMIRKLAKRFSN